ncbi:MAG: acyl-[acyl-carrier-protein]--UDP-N-acetylglucosamine O-acyltransferase, partial [Acidobacteriota bacterium]|nr:acyl-[acyl-carrier-protein]--UDP-N-acetylglucosamine O-acyltransferase [Acidobacteriota bacterium]
MPIHPTAIVDPGAHVSSSSSIGPYCVVGDGVEMGENCELISHVALHGPTRLGSHNRIFPFASVGLEPQDMKFKGEKTRLEIGDHNIIREFVTLHRGTPGGG